MGKPEGAVENYLYRKAKARGWIAYKFTSPGHAGVPDRIVVGNGKVYFVELKAANGRLSGLQKACIAKLNELGANVRVCYSKEDVDVVMKEMEA